MRTTGKKNKKNKSRWVEETPEKLSYICEQLWEENQKYKRLFDFLKEAFMLDKTKISEEKTIYFLILKDYYWEISQEEYELLEEWTSDERDR